MQIKHFDVSHREQAQKLQELFEILKHERNSLDDLDFSISEDNDDDENCYICFEQKIIHWTGENFIISCLYNTHKTLQYKTKEEVYNFFLSYNDSYVDSKGDFKPNSMKPTDEENAFNDGAVLYCMDFLKRFPNQLEKSYSKTQIVL